jgi:hypothetical protein
MNYRIWNKSAAPHFTAKFWQVSKRDLWVNVVSHVMTAIQRHQ